MKHVFSEYDGKKLFKMKFASADKGSCLCVATDFIIIWKNKYINVFKRTEIVLHRNILFSRLLLMATLLNGYSFFNGKLASGKLCNYKCFLITALFVKAKRNVYEKILVFIVPNFRNFLQKIYCGFLKIDLEELK